MAAVEKRKNPFLGLLLNHLLFTVVCLFIVFPTTGWVKIVFGSVMCFLYYNGVYGYSFKAGREHSQPFEKTNPSPKFPLYYGVIGCLYFWVPIVMLLVLNMFAHPAYMDIVFRLIYLVWDSPFIFLDIFTSTDYNMLNIWQPVLFTALYFGFSFFGYYMGKSGKPLAGIINSKFKRKDVKK